jgi:DnaJ domain
MVASRGSLLLLLVLCLYACSVTVANPSEDDDLMNEFLEEQLKMEEERMQEDNHQIDEAHFRRQEEERLENEFLREKERLEADERALKIERDKIRTKRETDFESAFSEMSKKQQAVARKQKRRDARIVQKVLAAFSNRNHYAVLGLPSYSLTIGPMKIGGFQIGPWTFFRAGMKNIRKAYRERAMMTHPDKNHDGRAQEAFIAVEESAAILSDDQKRADYDSLLLRLRSERFTKALSFFRGISNALKNQITRIFWIFRSFLGPFATPLLILGCLIV